MSTFYIKKEHFHRNTANIVGEDVNHIKNVLRCKIGEKVDVCNENGIKYLAQIAGMDDEKIMIDVIKEYSSIEDEVKVTLFQGLPKSDKMDLIVQKATELGVYNVVPVIMERTIVKIDVDGEQKKLERWNRIALEASKQSGRNIVPKVGNVENLSNIIEKFSDYDIVIVPYEQEKEVTMKQLLRDTKNKYNNIGIVIGPEGGFSEKDIDLLRANPKVKKVTLGPRILRTETAGFTALAIVMYELQN